MMFNQYSNPENENLTAHKTDGSGNFPPFEGFGSQNDAVKFSEGNYLSNDSSMDRDWNEMLNEFNSIEHDSGAFLGEESDLPAESTASRGVSHDSDESVNAFYDGFDDDIPDDNAENNDVVRPLPARTSSEQPDSAANKPNPVGRIMVVLVALIFGIGVLFVIKLNNSASFDDIPGDGSSQGYVTPSDDAEIADNVEIVSSATESQPESESETVSSRQPVDTSKYKEIKAGERTEDVLKMQKRLCELGYITEASCTGFYGKFTVSRIKVFQEAAGLEPTGEADPETLARLYADDAPKAK